MIILPAIDIKDRECVRLLKGDFGTVHRVADSPIDAAHAFKNAGAQWIHMVDLDGAKDGEKRNADIFVSVAKECGLKVEIGGGIRDMKTLDYYFSNGISRCILGSAALKNPALVKEAVAEYGHRIAVGIDALHGMVAAEGWLEVSNVPYLELAKRMEAMGVQVLIFTDISKDGTLSGPNLEQLQALREAVSCQVVASGGIHTIDDIKACKASALDGAICGKSLYSGTLSLEEALNVAYDEKVDSHDLDAYFAKSALIPAVVQDAVTDEVLMLAYMNRVSLQRTLETGTTWFWSRSRGEYWNKGATSGHFQHVVSVAGDCDRDTLLLKVKQTGAACHTGAHSCFFRSFEEGQA
ncbi:MAG: 1-(5-phosphoribosyl)-5-[Clostridia bacterium]|nr:1-(5-phosphoribosyl)-5-[(5-phosphoribosylamino)methylideneamino]imidazole-4-carboxamide isomerase [Clostridia bacterium]